MAPRKLSPGDGIVCELLLLFSLVSLWFGVTVLLGAASLFVWAGAIAMAAILRPPHQRNRVPETVTDLLSVAVAWCVVLGLTGVVVDRLAPARWSMTDLSWAFLGEMAGFYLGFVWVVVVLVARSVQQILRPFDRPRPTV